MDRNVFLQAARPRECLITFLAGIWFHPSMDHNVTLQAARPGECLITFLAFIRLLPSMDPNAHFQAARLGRNFEYIHCIYVVSHHCEKSYDVLT